MITINLPFPYPELSPNANTPWQVKHQFIKTYRRECMLDTKGALYRARLLGQVAPTDPPIPVTITFILKDKRRRDLDNLIASIKPLIDGLVDSGLLPDDSIQSWSPTFRHEYGDKAGVRVELS